MGGPRGKKIAPEVRIKIANHLVHGRTVRWIAKEVGVSLGVVSTIRSLLSTTGSAWPTKTGRAGRPPTLTAVEEEKLREFLAAYPSAFHHEIQQFVKDELGKDVSQPSISRKLKKWKWTSQKEGRGPRRRSQTHGEPSTASVSEYPAEMLAAINEFSHPEAYPQTTSNLRNSDPHTGDVTQQTAGDLGSDSLLRPTEEGSMYR